MQRNLVSCDSTRLIYIVIIKVFIRNRQKKDTITNLLNYYKNNVWVSFFYFNASYFLFVFYFSFHQPAHSFNNSLIFCVSSLRIVFSGQLPKSKKSNIIIFFFIRHGDTIRVFVYFFISFVFGTSGREMVLIKSFLI